MPHISWGVTSPTAALTGAEPTAAVLRRKVEDGASVEWLHERTNVPPTLLRALLAGEVSAVRGDVAARVALLADVEPPKARAPRPARGTPIGPVREHLLAKVAEGATFQWLVAQSGASESTVQSVLQGDRPTVYAKAAARLLAIGATPPPPKRPVDPRVTVERVRALVGAGWPLKEIARMAGLSERTVQDSELAQGVTAETEARIARVWAHLQGRPGPVLRSYPWLAEAIAGHPMTQVAAGAGVGYESVRRLVAGAPVKREVARQVCAWMVLTAKLHATYRWPA